MKKTCFSVLLLCALLSLGAGNAEISADVPDRNGRIATGNITGIVQCDTGGAVAGAVVSISSSTIQDRTGKTGGFRLRRIPAGNSTVVVEFDGSVRKTIDDVAVSGKSTTKLGIMTITCARECSTKNECGTGNYCLKTAGNCAGPGSCAPAPSACLQVYDPVCGCDGNTYPNECEAALVGVNVVSKGECAIPPPPQLSCADNTQCAPDEYCVKTVNECSASGSCGARPTACASVYDPVCGCDGNTYANACEAALAGVNSASQGACAFPPPPPVACVDNSPCAANEYCSKASGDCLGQGFCTLRPGLCLQSVDPVCGCNGITYSNECEAASAGVTVSYPGACTVPPEPSGCVSNVECSATQYCKKAAGDCDGWGSCATRPEICSMLYAPVLGCDGLIYSNNCFAAMSGVNIQVLNP